MNTEILLSCPFCSGERIGEIGFEYAECSDCKATAHLTVWNTRSIAAFQGHLKQECLVVVPIEPTDEMINSVNAACDTPDADLAWTYPVWIKAAGEDQ